tara:strand:+ start:2983 stop:3330 length:348 start_codon:yes stop_codon:yes gene_type:complete
MGAGLAMQFDRIPVVDTDDYNIELQPHINEDGFHMVFIHCDVTSTWTKSLKRELKQTFKELSSQMDTPMYANCEVNDEKHKKFLKMFDFKPQFLVQEPDSSDVYILYKHNSIGVH